MFRSTAIRCVLVSCIFLSTSFVEAQQRPKILEHPVDAVAAKEEPLILNCKAAGRPTPDIFWYHNGTPLVPSERRVILPEGSLFFLRVMHNKREQDAGVYWCEARSSAGIAVSKNATLQIAVLRDDFRSVPKNTVALVGGPVILNCTPPRGIPEPSVLWYKDKKLLDLSGKRLSMVEGGSLMISEVQGSDAGRYECSAQNMAASKTAPSAILKVLAPPTVVRGPQDSEVIEGEGLDIPCELVGDPSPIISWQRENGELPEGRSRTLLDNTLRIEDARAEDEGKYICRGYNEGGNVSFSIKLSVYAPPTFIEAPTDIDVKIGETINLPCRASGRPKPVVIWDRVTFENSNFHENEEFSKLLNEETQNEGLTKSKIMSFREKREAINMSINSSSLKYIRKSRRLLDDNNENNYDGILATELPSTLNQIILSSPIPDASNLEIGKNGELILSEIKESDEGWYACAALNEAGSVVKKIFLHVINSDESNIPFQIPDAPSNRWGSSEDIVMTFVSALSSNSVRVSWEITQPSPILYTAMTLYYRPIDINNSTTRVLSNEYLFNKVAISNKTFILTELKPHTVYEVFSTIPTSLAGLVSNLRKVKTKDGPPSAPPTDVRVGVINNTAAYVRWSPPPFHLLNGELTGYKIQIKSNVTNKLLGQMSLNATTQSVVINSLSPGGRYIARVAPLTSGGLGPYSAPAPLHMDPSFISRPPKSDSTLNTWTISWMPGIALGILGICLISGAIFAVFWARRNKRNLKAYPGQSLTSSLPDKSHTLWIHGNTTIKPTHSFVPSAVVSEYAEVTPTLISKPIKQSSPPEPYATVTLKGNSKMDDSRINCRTSPNLSDYNAPIRVPINICEMLPPPPDYPYESFKPSNNMTIRTNPAAISPQVMRRIPPTPPHWSTLPPPIPNFPQNWVQDRQSNPSGHHDIYTENEYESGSVLYEQFCRDNEASYFNEGGEPTEEYYRNVNMEFFEEQDFEPSTPPPPCPDSCNRINSNLRLLGNTKQDNSSVSSKRILRNVQQPRENCCDGNGHNSSDESESSDNRWISRTRRSRSRSKSNDRKLRNDQ